jgi:hypothetical protein
MSDKEVEVLLDNIEISKLTNRDSQEVVGYFDVLDLIVDSPNRVDVSESDIKNLHKMLLKQSEKDQ